MNLLHANDRPGEYPPSWYAETAEPLPPFPPLRGAVAADVCVVGGGYTGLSAALHLAEAGLSVTLLEAQRLGFGASGRNGGQVGSGQRLDQTALERAHGRQTARTLWRLAEEAKQLVRERIARHRIPAQMQPGIVHAMRAPGRAAAAAREAEHLARDYGYDRIEPLDREEMATMLGSRAFAGGAVDWGAFHLHPLRFVLGLAGGAEAAGVTLHEGSEAIAVEPGEPVVVRTHGGEVRARHVVLAANGYLGGLAPEIASRVMPINNFIVATEPLGERFPEILPRGPAVADDRFVVNYWRLSHDRRMLFGGGESYGYRFPRDIQAVVRPRLAAIYPQLADVRVTHAWGGTLAITRSRMPFLSRLAPNVLSASGYSGHGVAMACLAGRLTAEAMLGQAGRFDVMASLPAAPFPGGVHLRPALLALAMSWFALRDRLGF